MSGGDPTYSPLSPSFEPNHHEHNNNRDNEPPSPAHPGSPYPYSIQSSSSSHELDESPQKLTGPDLANVGLETEHRFSSGFPSDDPDDDLAPGFDIITVPGLFGIPKEIDVTRSLMHCFSDRAARSFKFQYESWDILEGSSMLDGIDQVARKLADAVQTVATLAKLRDRRIVFVAHDIGGIIVKKTLVLASQNTKWFSILGVTQVMLFSGCPHTIQEGKATIANFLFSTCPDPDKLIPTSHIALANAITRVNGQFLEANISYHTFIGSMYYAKGVPHHFIHPAFDKATATIGIPFERSFAGLPKRRYYDLSAILKEVSWVASYSLDYVPLFEPHKQALLSLAPPIWPLEMTNEPRLGDLPHPVTTSPNWKTWFTNNEHQLLHIYGTSARIAGYHSYTRYSALMDELNVEWDPSARRIVYFSFDRRDPRRNSVKSMLLALFAQIHSHAFQFLGHQALTLPRLMTVLPGMTDNDILRYFILSPGILFHPAVCLVLIGLDECHDRAAFLDAFHMIAARTDRKVRVIATSRTRLEELKDWPKIEADSVPTPPVPEPTTGCHLLDVNKEILAPFELPIKIFLLAQSQARLGSPQSRGSSMPFARIADFLGAVPTKQSQEDTVDWVLRGSGNSKSLRWLLAWLRQSKRRLSVWEIGTIMTIGSRNQSPRWMFSTNFCPEDWESGLEEAKTLLAGILEIRHNEVFITPYFADLFDNRATSSSSSSPYIWTELEDTTQWNMAKLLLDCLATSTQALRAAFLTFATEDSGDPRQHVARTFRPDRTELWHYAVEWWPAHLSVLPPKERLEMLDTVKSQCTVLSTWADMFWAIQPSMTRLNPAPGRGRGQPVLVGLGVLPCDVLHDQHDMAIAAGEAASRGLVHIVKEILEASPLGCKDLLNVLCAAACGDDEDLALYLVEKVSASAKVNMVDTVLPAKLALKAAFMGHSKLFRAILDQPKSTIPGHVANLQTLSCLRLAASLGHMSIVELLLDTPIDVNEATSGWPLVLEAVASVGEPRTIKALVERGKAIVDSHSPLTPLTIAVGIGNFQAAQELINHKANIMLVFSRNYEVEDVKVDIAFEDACFRGCTRTVEVLFDAGLEVDANTKNDEGEEIRGLALATRASQLATCRVLLLKGKELLDDPELAYPLFEEAMTNRETPVDRRLALVKLLFQNGAPVNAVSKSARTSALHTAAWSAEPLVIDWLIRHGGDVNARDEDSETPLIIAIRSSDRNKAGIRLMLEQEPDLSVVTSMGQTVLSSAVDDVDLVSQLLECGADPNLRGEWGKTPLMDCVYNRNTGLQLAKLLLRWGADVDCQTFDVDSRGNNDNEDTHSDQDEGTRDERWPGWTALMFAADCGWVEMFTLLADAGANLQHRESGDRGRAVIHNAIMYEDMARELLLRSTRIDINQRATYLSRTALHMVAHASTTDGGQYRGNMDNDNAKTLSLLLEAGADINAVDILGRTSLSLTMANNWNLADILVGRHDIDLNISAPGWGAPLHEACRHNKLELVQKILDRPGVDIDLQANGVIGTPLISACVPFHFARLDYPEGTEAIVRMLVERGATVNLQGGTILFNAISAACIGASPATIDILLENSASLTEPDVLGRLPIHFAAASGLENFKHILRRLGRGVQDVSGLRDKAGQTPLHFAAGSCRAGVVKEILSGLGIAHSQDLVDSVDIDGWTPLALAARWREHWPYVELASEVSSQIDAIKALLDYGASRTTKCFFGKEKKRWFSIRNMAALSSGIPQVDNLLAPDKEDEEAAQGGDNSDDNGENPPHGAVFRNTNGEMCQFCFWNIAGLFYTCLACDPAYILCSKCYGQKDILHAHVGRDHDFVVCEDDEFQTVVAADSRAQSSASASRSGSRSPSLVRPQISVMGAQFE